MKINHFVLLCFIACTSCKKDICGPVTIDNLFLTEESKAHFMYDGFEKAIFVDSDSLEYEFTIMHSGIEMNYENRTVECTEEYRNINLEREEKKVTLTGLVEGDHRIILELSTDFHSRETEFDEDHLVDVMVITHVKIGANGGGSSIGQSFITSNRGGVVDKNSVDDKYTEVENFELYGRNYGTVLQRASNFAGTIYYSKELGIVAMNDLSNKLLAFDRLE